MSNVLAEIVEQNSLVTFQGLKQASLWVALDGRIATISSNKAMKKPKRFSTSESELRNSLSRSELTEWEELLTVVPNSSRWWFRIQSWWCSSFFLSQIREKTQSSLGLPLDLSSRKFCPVVTKSPVFSSLLCLIPRITSCKLFPQGPC